MKNSKILLVHIWRVSVHPMQCHRPQAAVDATIPAELSSNACDFTRSDDWLLSSKDA